MKKEQINLALVTTILFILFLIILFYQWPGSESLIIIPDEEKTEERFNPESIQASTQENQEENPENQIETEVRQEQSALIFEDIRYGFLLTVNSTDPSCKEFYDVRVKVSRQDAVRSYDVYVPGSESWLDPESAWYTYHLFTQDAYSAIETTETSGLPRIILELENDLILAAWDPQDGPSEITESCLLKAEKI